MVAQLATQELEARGIRVPKKNWVERVSALADVTDHLGRAAFRVFEVAAMGGLVIFLFFVIFRPADTTDTFTELARILDNGTAYALALILAALRIPKMLERLFPRNGHAPKGKDSD